MKRILIEGIDLSGKTTTAKELTRVLINEGYNVKHLKGEVTPYFKNPIRYMFSWYKARNNPRSSLLNSVYLLSGIIDSIFIRFNSPSQIVIVESHVDRSIAYRKSLKMRKSILIKYPTSLYPIFDLAILLNSSYKNRVERLKSRPDNEKNLVDEVLTSDPAIGEIHLKSYRETMKRHKNLVEVNTDKLPNRELVRSIVERYF